MKEPFEKILPGNFEESELLDLSVSKTSLFSSYSFEIDENKYKLLPLQAIACAIVLEEAADELAILGQIGNFPDITALQAEKAAPIFNVFDPITMDPFAISSKKQRFIKHQKDRTFVEVALRQTAQRLAKEDTFIELVNQLTNYDKTVYVERDLLDQEARNHLKLQELEGLVEKERSNLMKQIDAASVAIGTLKDQLQDLIAEHQIFLTYNSKWENSRMEQNTHLLDSKEDSFLQIIRDTNTEIERENRVNAEIVNFIQENLKDMQEQIQMWMEKYDKDSETRELQNQKLREARDCQSADLCRMKELYEQHQQEIKDYLDYKEKKKKEEEWRKKQIKAAIKIQAWWRGTMVRRGLGPYKKKRGKPSGKKK